MQKTTYAAVLGQVLEEKRKEKRHGQDVMAAALGISQPSWSRIVLGQSVLNAEQLHAAAQALGIAPHDILALVDERIAMLEEQGVEIITTKEAKEEKGDQNAKGGPGIGTILIGAALTGFILALMSRR